MYSDRTLRAKDILRDMMAEPNIESLVIAFKTIPGGRPEVISTRLSPSDASDYWDVIGASLRALFDEALNTPCDG